MPTNSSDSFKKPKGKRNLLAEVSDTEKQLWARILSGGLLGTDVKDLYSKSCCIYEKLFLSENELSDLQHIEYLLWRLHYKHIDEFRRRISQSLAKEEDKLSTNPKIAASRKNMGDAHMKGFKLFLSEATKFYQDLIRKIKRYYGLFDEPWFYKNDRVSGHTEQMKLHKCQFVCHRLCICLGDLARYLELYEKPETQQRNWSIAANHYLEAAKIYPEGGNPQNQLAVLATYIGDDFLALYHCIRSLAVKEPFPDALQNLMLLFERNRSSNIGSISDEVYDFGKPSQWISTMSKATTNGGSSNKTTLKAADRDQSVPTDLWSLIIRMTSFFFLESSLDSFFCIFTSALRELEALLELDVIKLSSALESYKNMNLSKAGPYRALHLISVLLFIIHNLHGELERKILKPTNKTHHSMLLKFAFTVTFICMGRFVDRCLKGSPIIYFPLLPALLVFVEWLVDALDKVDASDEKCGSAVCYFFGSFVKLLNYMQQNMAPFTLGDHIALWEDYELRGFIPSCHTQLSLDFSSHWEEEINYKMKNEIRAHRIVQAAMVIAERSSDNTRKWLFYDEVGRKFSTVGAKESVERKDSEEQKSCSVPEAKETFQQIYTSISAAVEEEEDIVFKPIVRHNSEPIPTDDQAIASASDECLRRASSLLVAQNRAFTDSMTSHFATFDKSSKQLWQNEPPLGSSTPSTDAEGPIAAGPPSLSSWVLNGERLSSPRAKSTEIDRSVLKPIQEMAAEDLRGLSLNKAESSSIYSPVTSPSTYCVPVPSAPLLPENAVWFTGTSAGKSPRNSAAHDSSGFVSASRTCVSSNPSNVHQAVHSVTSFIDYAPPFLAPTNPYMWPKPHFPKLGNQNLQPAYNHATREQFLTTKDPNAVNGSKASRFDLLDGWSYNHPLAASPTIPPLLQPSSSLLRGLYDQRRDMLLQDHQRPSPNVPGATMDTRAEPQPLLQYLKQREWQLQQESPFTGSPYMQK